MNDRPVAPACLPPTGITGLKPEWSRLVHVPATDQTGRTWHLLDSWATRTAAAKPALTLLCVHGNPSWSFLWRKLLSQVSATADDQVRVIAVDQLDMGFSERTGQQRILSTRINDLCQLTDTLGITGPVVTVAHDWGGPISLGWALRHLPAHHTPSQQPGGQATAHLAGVVLTNTAVHQPAQSSAPAVIRFIRTSLALNNITVNTRAFIRGAIEMSRPRLDPVIRDGFHAPYLKRSQRAAIADFVADIPLDDAHESAATLQAIADGLTRLSHVPALLLWGPRDKVFSDLYLHDLEARLPHAHVHRFPTAAHFVGEDADVAGAVGSWINQLEPIKDVTNAMEPPATVRTTAAAVGQRALYDFSVAAQTTEAVVEIAPVRRAISFAELSVRVEQLAAGMASYGIKAGDRIAVMITPGIDLSLAVYACWRLGTTLVLVDSGLGRSGMQNALQSANPRYLLGIDKALVASRVLRWPGIRIATGKRSAAMTRLLGIATDMTTLTERGKDQSAPPHPTPDTLAAIAFTSGSTGPSKGVIYRHHQIQAQRDALMSLYAITSEDRLVAAFAPFALYGPTMGITSIVPNMDVTSPATLDAQSLADAVACVNATLVFASPAALVNIVQTRSALNAAQKTACAAVRTVISAGAPVREELLKATTTIFVSAEMHTPYGMTEALPVANISLEQLQRLSDADDLSTTAARAKGVCVGYPLAGVTVHIDPLDAYGKPSGKPGAITDMLGEILVQGAHTRERYDRLWFTDSRASQPVGWHRTGDVGELDTQGRLWVGGRLGHIMTPAGSVLAPVASEQRIETLNEVSMAAVVGVGPIGAQIIVAVLQLLDNDQHRSGGASMALTDQVRNVSSPDIDLAAVLVVKRLPVDRRHNSKIDRSAVATWAGKVLAGERASPP